MLFGEIVIVALQSIRANLFRAILTMLGIIIGVGAVITMLAAGAGAQKRIDDQIAALGSNILTVNAAQFFSGGISRDRQTLVVDDVDALIADNRYLDAVVPEMQNRGQLKLKNVNTNTRLVGTTADYATVFNYKLAHGRFFTPEEDELRSRVVVLGADIPDRLEIEPDQLVGRSISVNGQPFQIIGIFESIGGGFGNQSPDASAVIPFRTAEQRVFGRKQMDNISVRVAADASMERAMVDIERVLRREHKLTPGTANDFNYRSDKDGMQCPLHAHIRKVNPRGDRVLRKGGTMQEERAKQIARRGMTYGPHDPADPTPYWLVSAPEPERLAAALTAGAALVRGRDAGGPDTGGPHPGRQQTG